MSTVPPPPPPPPEGPSSDGASFSSHAAEPLDSTMPPPPPPPLPDSAPGPATIDTTNENADDGVNRCPQCGSTEIQLRPSAGLLICLFCRHEWSEARLDTTVDSVDLGSLTGTTIGSGAADIDTSAELLVTMKCGGCGAEVVVNTAEQMSSRCHWCRHVLTVNEQIPNGAVPDAVLPFSVTHEQAVEKIRAFAGKRKMFAHREFVNEFTPENVVGVYMPYMVVDVNATAEVTGVGEIETRRYTEGSGDDEETFYDADIYAIDRRLDFVADDLTIEASSERANRNTSVNTNNIINTILPFDTENAVKWNASYLTGFTSEKRDMDVVHTTPEMEHQLMSIARAQLVGSVSAYDRGVRWEREKLDVHGTRWLAMCLPVWLYSYYHEENGKAMVHYIAVNGRTGEVMGSVPVSHGRLLAAALTAGTFLEALVIAFMVASS